MLPIIGSIILGAMAVMSVLLIIGLPLGELTMGGKYRVLPPKMRIAAAFSIILQTFAALMLLQKGGIAAPWFSDNALTIICYCFTVYFVINALMNSFSHSDKERFIMTPLATLMACIFALTANGIEIQ